MTYKKKILFTVLTASIIIPISSLGAINASDENNTIPDKVPDQVIRIPEPVMSQIEKDEFKQVENIAAETETLEQEEDLLETKRNSGTLLTQSEVQRLGDINKRLTELDAEFDVLQEKAYKRFEISTDDMKQLMDAKKLIKDAGIPTVGLGPNSQVGALEIGFLTQQDADTYIPQIEQLIDVPYYIVIHGSYGTFTARTCSQPTSNCDPLMGGVKIVTEYNSTASKNCSYSIPATRNI